MILLTLLKICILRQGREINEKYVWEIDYKYYLDNYEIDEIYISKLKPHVEVAHASNPLYFPDVEKYGYKLVSEIDYNDFTATIYKK